jgi:hypothetical protein
MDDGQIEVQPLPFDDEEPRGLLYHYTSLEGLIGIINGKSLRATHVRYLNDISEIRHAFSNENTKALIGELLPGLDEPKYKILSEALNGLIIPNEDRYDAFIISFTDDAAVSGINHKHIGARLSQWRGYSGGSGGFSLGFDSKRIMGAWESCQIKDTGAGLYLLRCEYEPEEKMKAAKNVGAAKRKDFDSVHAQYMKLFNEENHRAPDEAEAQDLTMRANIRVLSAAFTDYYLRAARFKNEAFSEEAEWRIIIHTVREKLMELQNSNPENPLLRFRAGKFGLTPYIDFPVALTSTESPLRRIVVGPMPHRDEALNAVKLLLKINGIQLKTESDADGVEVVGSSIPYRNW